MRASAIIIAHNEGDLLWRTVRSWLDAAAGQGCEVLVADDFSSDGSIAELDRRFPRVRVVRHDAAGEAKRGGGLFAAREQAGFPSPAAFDSSLRRGVSATRDLGARHARGEILFFADAHTNPAPGAVRRMIDDVERLRGGAVVTPAIPSLNVARWTNCSWQIGHGYRLELRHFGCGWLPLSKMRSVQHGGRTFYESPAAIGCALAVHRELYELLHGFDPHMINWGAEDLDFSLRCWMLGYPILHDPEAAIGHRFRRKMSSFRVPAEDVLANKLRMARKCFTDGVWGDWLARWRRRLARVRGEHPEGQFLRAWSVFESLEPSLSYERQYLQGRRVRDEFWYATRFALDWPRIASKQTLITVPEPEDDALAFLLQGSSGAPCPVTEIVPNPAMVCIGETIGFTALSGQAPVATDWSTSPAGDPATAQGEQTFVTKWTSTGMKTVTFCAGMPDPPEVSVTVVAVDKIVVDGTSNQGPLTACMGPVTLLAVPTPAGNFPQGSPVWTFVQKPPGSTLTNPPAGSATAVITPDKAGTYIIRATCGTSLKEFTLHAVKVIFSPTIVKTGYTIPVPESTISRTLVASVEPKSAVGSVTLQVGGDDRVTLGTPAVDTQAGTITVAVKGKTRTPAGFPNGDTTIEAVVGGTACDDVPVVVLVPEAIKTPYPQADGNVQPVNLVLDRTTSPAFSVEANEVALVTARFHWLTVTVEDQFGDVLDGLYAGAKVEERWRLRRFDINQTLSANGTYQDPVGFASWPEERDVQATSGEAIAWPNEDKLAMPPFSQRQRIRVFVGGHEIGNINRQVIGTDANHIEIKWPP